PGVSWLYDYAGTDGNPNSQIAFNMDLAEKYYVQAMNLSSNKELKAKAAFMAAKTEQNLRSAVDVFQAAQRLLLRHAVLPGDHYGVWDVSVVHREVTSLRDSRRSCADRELPW